MYPSLSNEQPALPSLDQTPKIPGTIQDSVDENGIRTIVEFTINDEGKKVKVSSLSVEYLIVVLRLTCFQVTRRIKRTLQTQLVNHTIAERKQWAKFGQENGNKPGPDRATTTVGENVTLKLSVGNKVCSVT